MSHKAYIVQFYDIGICTARYITEHKIAYKSFGVFIDFNIAFCISALQRLPDIYFYTVFQLSGQAIMEQDERQVQIGAGDITLLDASRPCSLYW